jgi:hypothetical protein
VTLTLGQRMVRLEDGVKGVVGQNGPELRIFWEDRGEQLMAAKSEKWEPDTIRSGKMRSEETHLVALYADRALRAVEQHEPLKWWDAPRPSEPIYCAGLVKVIEEYLEHRERYL